MSSSSGRVTPSLRRAASMPSSMISRIALRRALSWTRNIAPSASGSSIVHSSFAAWSISISTLYGRFGGFDDRT